MTAQLPAPVTKVDLLIEPWKGWCAGPRPHPVLRMAPWYRSRYSRRSYVHRVRSALLHTNDVPPFRNEHHISIRLWCGQHGSSHHGEVFPDVPPDSFVCATCEARAMGAGFGSGVLLATKPLRFTPRLSS